MSQSQHSRVQLEQMIDAYLAALLARDPSQMPVSPGCRFTENGVAIPLGEALWRSIDRLDSYRVDYIDPDAGQAASHVAFVENDRAGLMALRIRVEDGLITEVETILHRSAPMALNMPKAEPLWFEAEDPSGRLNRDALAAETENYLKAVAMDDGSQVRFNRQSAIRLENGILMAIGPNDEWPYPMRPIEDPDSWFAAVRSTLGMHPADQLSTGIYSFITSYDNARFPVIDVERQVVFGVWNFRRLGTVRGMTLNGQYYPHMAGTQCPNENLLGQAFKFRDGAITRVQGVFLNANVYKAGTGWDMSR